MFCAYYKCKNQLEYIIFFDFIQRSHGQWRFIVLTSSYRTAPIVFPDCNLLQLQNVHNQLLLNLMKINYVRFMRVRVMHIDKNEMHLNGIWTAHERHLNTNASMVFVSVSNRFRWEYKRKEPIFLIDMINSIRIVLLFEIVTCDCHTPIVLKEQINKVHRLNSNGQSRWQYCLIFFFSFVVRFQYYIECRFGYRYEYMTTNIYDDEKKNFKQHISAGWYIALEWSLI